MIIGFSRMLRLSIPGLILIAGSVGCASTQQRDPVAAAVAEEPAPLPSEYPVYETTQSTYPVSVGVIDASGAPKKPLLEPLEPIELTEREKEILAEELGEPEYDALALYPGQGPANITPETAGPSVGVYGETNRVAGSLPKLAPRSVGLYDAGRVNVGVGTIYERRAAGHLPTAREPAAGVRPPSEIDVGYLPARRHVSYDPTIDRD